MGIETDSPAVELSIVTTLFRSASYIEEFYTRVSAEAEKIAHNYEIVMVDDGSPDDSLERALSIVERDPRVKVIELSRNFGHHRALITGLEHASGAEVFLIDVDLEEPPELLGEFYECARSGGWDVVYGCQEVRKGGVVERWCGALSWWLVKALVPMKIPLNHSTVRLMKRDYVQALVRHREQKTAIGGLWVLTGFRQTGLQFTKHARGVSSYSFRLRVLALLDSIASFSERPLYGVFFFGLGILMVSLMVSVGLIGLWLSGKTFPGWISVMVSVWLLGGLSIFCIGLVGLYISRIFIETKMRPYVIIRKIYNTRCVSRIADDGVSK